MGRKSRLKEPSLLVSRVAGMRWLRRVLLTVIETFAPGERETQSPIAKTPHKGADLRSFITGALELTTHSGGKSGGPVLASAFPFEKVSAPIRSTSEAGIFTRSRVYAQSTSALPMFRYDIVEASMGRPRPW